MTAPVPDEPIGAAIARGPHRPLDEISHELGNIAMIVEASIHGVDPEDDPRAHAALTEASHRLYEICAQLEDAVTALSADPTASASLASNAEGR